MTLRQDMRRVLEFEIDEALWANSYAWRISLFNVSIPLNSRTNRVERAAMNMVRQETELES